MSLEMHSVNTVHEHDFWMPNASLTSFWKGMLSGTKLHSAVPPNMILMNHNKKVL